MGEKLEKAKELIGLGCGRISLETETKDWSKKFPKIGTEKDKKGNSVDIYSDGQTSYNAYDYAVVLYTYNESVLEQKIEGLLKHKIQRYVDAIKQIDDYIDQREAEYRAKEIDVIQKRKVLGRIRENYNRGLERRFFHRGDPRERALRQRIEALTEELPRLSAKESIYAANCVDMDHPDQGTKFFSDIRVLKREYAKRQKLVEKFEKEPLEMKLVCNGHLLGKARDDRKAYYEWLNAPAPKKTP